MAAIAALALSPATIEALIMGTVQLGQFVTSQINLYNQGGAVTEAQLQQSIAMVTANTSATTKLLEQAIQAATPVAPITAPVAVAVPVVQVANPVPLTATLQPGS